MEEGAGGKSLYMSVTFFCKVTAPLPPGRCDNVRHVTKFHRKIPGAMLGRRRGRVYVKKFNGEGSEVISEGNAEAIPVSLAVLNHLGESPLILEAEIDLMPGVAGTETETHLETLALNTILEGIT